MNKNILITGGAGFIGSNLSLRLVSLGYNVTVLDNLSEQIHGHTSSLYVNLNDKVRLIRGDVRDKEIWSQALDNQDVVVHLAAETGTGQSMYQIQNYADVNVNGTAFLLDYLVNHSHHIQKVVLASSRAVYGEGKYFCHKHGEIYPNERKESDLLQGIFEPRCPFCQSGVEVLPTDEMSSIHPISVYGITKYTQEQIITNICKSLNIPFVIFRYQNVYGPGQSLKNPYTGILSIFSTQIRNGNNINIFEDGRESRDFVYIDDVVEATILGVEKNEANFQVFNVGAGEKNSVLEIAEKLKKHFNSEIKINVSGNFRLGDIRHNVADIGKINKELGFTPKYTLDKGLEQFLNWVNSQEIPEDFHLRSMDELRNRKLLK